MALLRNCLSFQARHHLTTDFVFLRCVVVVDLLSTSQTNMSGRKEPDHDMPDDLLTTVKRVISANDRSAFKHQNITLTATDIKENVKGQCEIGDCDRAHAIVQYDTGSSQSHV